MKYYLTLCTFLAVAACQADTGEDDLEASCGDAGGTVRMAFVGPFCAMPTLDEGTACTDSSDCAGLCLNTGAGGQCSAEAPMVGCNDIIEFGEPVTLCID